MSHRNFHAELPKAKQVRFHGSLWATRSWTQALYFWEALTISGQGPSGRTAGLMQSHTQREDLDMVSPKSGHPPTHHRDPSTWRQRREAEETFHTYTLFTTHTTKPSRWKGFKAAVRSSYSQMGPVQRNPSLWIILLTRLATLIRGYHLCSNRLVVCRWSLGGSTLS